MASLAAGLLNATWEVLQICTNAAETDHCFFLLNKLKHRCAKHSVFCTKNLTTVLFWFHFIQSDDGPFWSALVHSESKWVLLGAGQNFTSDALMLANPRRFRTTGEIWHSLSLSLSLSLSFCVCVCVSVKCSYLSDSVGCEFYCLHRGKRGIHLGHSQCEYTRRAAQITSRDKGIFTAFF